MAAASDKVYQLLAYGRWFSPGTLASSTTKTGRHDIAEVLLKVALNTKNQSINLLIVKSMRIYDIYSPYKFLGIEFWNFTFWMKHTYSWWKHSTIYIFVYHFKVLLLMCVFSPKTCNQISCITCWLYFILSEHLMCVISLKQIDISIYKLVSESCCHNNCNIFCLIVLHYSWTKNMFTLTIAPISTKWTTTSCLRSLNMKKKTMQTYSDGNQCPGLEKLLYIFTKFIF